MQNELIPTWMATSLGILLIILLALVSANQFRALRPAPQTMSVSATGKMTVTPDLATVNIGVASEGVNQIDVQNQNNQKINQVINFIKQQNIPAKDIKTSGFYASPRYQYENGKNSIVGYQANQMITVQVHNIDQSTEKLAQIVNGAITNGANQIQGVNFSISDNDKIDQVVRKQAIDKARKKAQEIANDAHFRLGRIVNVITSESNGVIPRPYAINALAKAEAATPNIEAGSEEVSENVTVVFEVF